MQITTPGKPTDMIRDAGLNHVFDFDDFQMNASAVRFSDGKKHRKDGTLLWKTLVIRMRADVWGDQSGQGAAHHSQLQ